VEWFRELYDDFRQRTGFGNLPTERTARDVDFIIDQCGLRAGQRVLDVCAGTGRHSIELERRGIRATAFELNPEYVALAAERASIAEVSPLITVGDVRTAEFGTGFDAAILMWHSFGYFSDPENLALLKKVRNALRPGGRFVLEVLNRDFLLRYFEARAERVVEGVQVVEERELDMRTSRMKTVITRQEGAAIVTRCTDWRLYSLHELSALGTGVGLGLIAAYGGLDGRPADLETRLMRLVFVRDKI
jgi:SAM-dependent methyltransferase